MKRSTKVKAPRVHEVEGASAANVGLVIKDQELKADSTAEKLKGKARRFIGPRAKTL
jgi:uncharacterized protein YjbJ (UPF0337 family)